MIRLLLAAVWLLAASGAARAERCDRPPAYRDAAAENAQTLSTLAWAPFGRPEPGWAIYAPKIASEIRTDCAPETPGFARALARWRRRNHTGAGGAFDAEVFQAMKTGWQQSRPFVVGHACPDPPELTALDAAAPEESDGGKIILLRRPVRAA